MRYAVSILLLAVVAATAGLIPTISDLLAQGITTATIHGTARATDGTDVDGTEVVVLNTSTGYVARVEVRNGGFFVSGLEAGGPYTVTAQRFGFHPVERQESSLEVGETLELMFRFLPFTVIALCAVLALTSCSDSEGPLGRSDLPQTPSSALGARHRATRVAPSRFSPGRASLSKLRSARRSSPRRSVQRD